MADIVKEMQAALETVERLMAKKTSITENEKEILRLCQSLFSAIKFTSEKLSGVENRLVKIEGMIIED